MLTLRRVVPALTVLYWLALFVATHLPAGRLPIVPVTDKTLHFVTYAILAAGMCLSLHLMHRSDAVLPVLIIGLAYGAIDEWLQIPVGRTCEIADWYADAAGVAAGVIVMSLILRFAQPRP